MYSFCYLLIRIMNLMVKKERGRGGGGENLVNMWEKFILFKLMLENNILI